MRSCPGGTTPHGEGGIGRICILPQGTVAISSPLPLQYESTAPTANSNRVCANVSACNTTTEYEAAPPTPTSNRVCLPLTSCGATAYLAEASNGFHDNLCVNATVCHSETEYALHALTPTSDRVCAPIAPPCLATCHANVQTPGGAACQCGLDGACRTCSGPAGDLSAHRCSYCAPGFALIPATRTCVAASTCPSNTTAVATDEHGHVCASGPLSASDLALLKSPPLEYEAHRPLPTANRRCAAVTVCDFSMEYEATRATLTSDSVCRAVSACEAQSYLVAPATRTSDTLCRLVGPA